jgi:hypothetical protein
LKEKEPSGHSSNINREIIAPGSGGHERLKAVNAKCDPEGFFDRPFR